MQKRDPNPQPPTLFPFLPLPTPFVACYTGYAGYASGTVLF